MTVLILGSMADEHSCHMLEHLRDRGADAELLDSGWFPSHMQISYSPDPGTGHLRLPTERLLAMEEIRSVYWRCYNPIEAPDLPDPEQAYIASNDSRGLLESFFIQLPAQWVNSIDAYQLHQTKPVQLAKVSALGARIPATTLTNDPESVREFVGKYPQCIFKPVQGGAHTRRVTEEHLTEKYLQNLALAPVTLQEEVVGTDIRVFVIGDEVMACEIRTEAVDFRDDLTAGIERHSLPEEMETLCLAIARDLKLLWTGMDFRWDGEAYVFLEANPSPMFMGFEERSGLPLTDALGSLLLG